MTSIDAYHRLLEEEGAEEIEARLRAIDERYRFGSASSSAAPLFETELLEAKAQGEQARGEAAPAELLILLAGSSPEPLLLAVAYHGPAEVVLLTGKGPESWQQPLETLWDHYRDRLGMGPFSTLLSIPVGGSPAELFQTVRQIVERRRQAARPRIVLDITGAKKSMIAGAFLAAGFLDLETSYVDFDDYDPLLRRPIPGTSRPRCLEHPHQLFRLREESRLEEAFDGRRWEEAERLAAELAGMAGSEGVLQVLEPEEAERLARRYQALSQVASAYRSWSEGFFADARDALRSLPELPVAPTVELLGGAWPRRGDDHPRIRAALAPKQVFADPTLALAYFLDVLVWADERRLEQRPRETYLRLYGTIESVFSYTFAAFAGVRGEHLALGSPTAEDLESLDAAAHRATGSEGLRLARARHTAARKCLDESSRIARAVLCGGAFTAAAGKSVSVLPRRLKKLPGWTEPRELRAWLAHPPEEDEIRRALACEGCETHEPFEQLARLRNKATHWLAPVPVRLARELHELYRSVLQSLIPPAVARWRAAGATPEPLEAWQRRLLLAAAGDLPESCRPLGYAAVLEHLASGHHPPPAPPRTRDPGPGQPPEETPCPPTS